MLLPLLSSTLLDASRTPPFLARFSTRIPRQITVLSPRFFERSLPGELTQIGTMKTHFFLFLCLVVGGLNSAQAQGTSFTFQGRLDDGDAPATGIYDLAFGVWTSPSGATQVG